MHQPQVMCDSNFYDIILLHKYEYLNYFDNLTQTSRTNTTTTVHRCHIKCETKRQLIVNAQSTMTVIYQERPVAADVGTL